MSRLVPNSKYGYTDTRDNNVQAEFRPGKRTSLIPVEKMDSLYPNSENKYARFRARKRAGWFNRQAAGILSMNAMLRRIATNVTPEKKRITAIGFFSVAALNFNSA